MEEDGCKGQPPTKITIKDERKPAEIYRTDLITAMKIPDHHLVPPGSYFNLIDPWKQEWEKGVQVPVNMASLPQPSFNITESGLQLSSDFKLPNKLLKGETKKDKESPVISYDLDDEDVEWLRCLNRSRRNKGLEPVDEFLMEKAIACLEDQCYTNMGETISTEKGLTIEYDENITCDVCRVPDCEDGNEIVFCDVCDVAVHQACYGVQKVPVGSWVCRPCALALSNCPCLLCPNRGGALKRTKSKGFNGWVHMSCALWVPEVGIGDVEKMEPITRLETITPGRWNLLCYICKERKGACIQCSVKTCVTAFHVTCGFNNNLEMQTVLDESAPDGVRHVCYCYKHGSKKCSKSPRKSLSGIPKSPRRTHHKSPCTTPSKSSAKDEEKQENIRQKKLRGMEEEFYNFADIKDLASELQITNDLAKTFHHFWTLKRKARDDASLLPPTAEQQENLTGRQIKPYQRASMEIERVVRLRQDLERIRNLCYMVERREKQKRELTKARETVFWKEMEIVMDNSGKMSSDDVQWARSCCMNDFTEYETSRNLDLNYRKKTNTYNSCRKRGRPRGKSEGTPSGRPRGRPRGTKRSVPGSGEEKINSANISGETNAFDKEVVIGESSDSTDYGESSTVQSMDNIDENSVDTDAVKTAFESTVASSEAVSNDDRSSKEIPDQTCCASSLGAAKRLGDMSSDSDLEDESLLKIKRRSALRRRLVPLKSTKKGQQKNGIIRCNDATSSSSGQSNNQLNGQLKRPKHERLSPAQPNERKIYKKISNEVYRSSSDQSVESTFKKNKRRLLDEFSRKIEASVSKKIAGRSSRSNGALLDGKMVLDKCDLLVPQKRLCRRTEVPVCPKNDENVVLNGPKREHKEKVSDQRKVELDVSYRTRSHSSSSTELGSPLAFSTRTGDEESKRVSAERSNKSNHKLCIPLKESLTDRCRTRRSPGKLSDNLTKSSLGNAIGCSTFFRKFRQTATTSA